MKKVFSLLLALAMLLTLAPMAVPSVHADTWYVSDSDIAYPVEGGNIYFDKEMGEITGADESVIRAEIPAEIEGVPVTWIYSSAFCDCADLTSVSIPETVRVFGYVSVFTGERIEADTFYCGTSLKEIVVSEANQNYCSVDGVLFNKDMTRLILYPAGKMDTEYAIPDSVTEIQYSAFRGCNSLTAVTIPSNVSKIRERAFAGCTGLTAVDIPDGLELIEEEAFTDCTGLTSVFIPDSVTEIERYAFADCTNLTAAIFEGDAPEKFGCPHIEGNVTRPEGVFQNTAPGFMIYYPEGATGWTTPTWKGYKTQSYKPGEEPWNWSFSDVPDGKWYSTSVAWAVGQGITSGTSANTFSPNQQCTRAQVVTFLWAMAGKPAPKNGRNPFVDVPKGQWYTDAVLWAVEQGITSGIDATHFGPNNKVTREQFVTFLWAYARKPAPENSASPFKDVTAGKWYTNPVLWAVENAVTSGVGGGKFGTGTICTRAQVVTFLYAYNN